MTQQQGCWMCKDPIIQQKGYEHPRKVAELEVSTAVLRPTYQYFRGYTILVLRQHAQELWQLDQETRQKFMEEASQVAHALDKTFKPLKMNYSLLGNTDPVMDHLHWHLTPRHLTDPNPKNHIAAAPFPEVSLSDEEFRQMADEIRSNL